MAWSIRDRKTEQYLRGFSLGFDFFPAKRNSTYADGYSAGLRNDWEAVGKDFERGFRDARSGREHPTNR